MPVPEFSQMLTERRRQLGYSVGQAARALRLKESVLEAFEAGDFASMPKSGYAQGMLASYARFLGLDAQEVTDLFAESLADYRSGVARGAGYRGARDVRSSGYRRRPASNQPQVPRRGLLPTSGGIAGDLGDYATTSRVHPHSYARPYGTGEPSAAGTADRQGGYARYDRGVREGERRRRRGYYGRDDVTTAPVSSEYVDDLRFGNDARAYDPASSESGRASYRNLATPERPQVQRRPSSRQRQQVRGRSRSRRPKGLAGMLAADPMRFIGIIVILVAVIITLILLLAFNSCSFGVTTGDGNKSVPVSQTTTSSTTNSNSSNANDKSAEEAAAEQKIASSSTNGDDESDTQTVVEVTVADDAVTWLEIDCDGSSKIAETVTGPWSQTYTVTESITVQVGDTTAVTVTKNGRQVQFDSRASGLGTVTIQGTKVETTRTDAGTGTNSTRTTTGGNGNANANTAGASSANASSASSSDASSTSGTSSSTGSDSTSATTSGASGSSGSTGGGRTTSSDGGRTTASLGRADGSSSAGESSS